MVIIHKRIHFVRPQTDNNAQNSLISPQKKINQISLIFKLNRDILKNKDIV
jgi:hypothetical protein